MAVVSEGAALKYGELNGEQISWRTTCGGWA